MKKILLIISALFISLWFASPITSKAVEYNGEEYGSVTRFSTDYGYYSSTDKTYNLVHHDYVLTSSNPDVKIVVFTQDVGSGDAKSTMCWYFALGGSTHIKIFDNGNLISDRDYPEIDIDYVNSHLENHVQGTDDDNPNIYLLFASPDWFLSKPGGEPTFYDISGYFKEWSYTDFNGSPTYSYIKDIIDNLEDLRVLPDEYDSTMPTPVIEVESVPLSYLDTIGHYDYFAYVENGSDNYKLEYRIKLYGPSVLYIKDGGLFENEKWVVQEEIASEYFYTDLLSTSNIIRFGTTYNSGQFNYSDNHIDLLDLSSSFTKNLSLNVDFEYDDVWTSLNADKASYRTQLAFANIEFYDFEIYSRFVDDSGSTRKNGGWSHLVVERGGTVKRNQEGIENPPEDNEDTREDDDLVVDNPDIPLELDGSSILDYLKSFYEFLETLISSMGNVPNIVSSIFGFLPSWIIYAISAGILLVIVFRFLGR